jgi:hypothetical protein
LFLGDRGLSTIDMGTGEVKACSSLIGPRSVVGVWQLLILLLASVNGDRIVLESEKGNVSSIARKTLARQECCNATAHMGYRYRSLTALPSSD